MELLTLPGPAGELWAAKREVLHSLPAETLARPIRPHLGGGTVLSARWGHRLSADVDVLLPGRETLIDLLWDDERNLARRLGGELEAVDVGAVSGRLRRERCVLTAESTPGVDSGRAVVHEEGGDAVEGESKSHWAAASEKSAVGTATCRPA